MIMFDNYRDMSGKADTEALAEKPRSRQPKDIAQNLVKTVRNNLLFVLTLAAVAGGLILGNFTFNLLLYIVNLLIYIVKIHDQQIL